MKRICSILFCILLLNAMTSGCGAVYKVAMDKRSISTQVKDEQITMTIRQKFINDKRIKVLDVSTYCYGGHVYLVGEYANLSQRQRVLKLVRDVEGVRTVTTHLLPKKKEKPCGTTDNIKLAAIVKAKLIGDKNIWSTNIEVKAVQCNIVLLGIVGSQKQIRRAIAHAKAVDGVRSVTSYLKTVK